MPTADRAMSDVTIHFSESGPWAAISRGSKDSYRRRLYRHITDPSRYRLWRVLLKPITSGTLEAIIWPDGWSVYPVEKE